MAFIFFNDTATTEIDTLSLHDALPICQALPRLVVERLEQRRLDLGRERRPGLGHVLAQAAEEAAPPDRKSTRLNSSHANISYAVFCLKKKTRIAIRRARRPKLYRIYLA